MKILKGLKAIYSEGAQSYPTDAEVTFKVALYYDAPIYVYDGADGAVYLVARSLDSEMNADIIFTFNLGLSDLTPSSGLAKVIFTAPPQNCVNLNGLRYVIDTMSSRTRFYLINGSPVPEGEQSPNEPVDPVEDSLAAYTLIFTVGHYLDVDDVGPF